MDDFIKGEGLAFLAHVLRRLSDEFVRGCEAWYPEFGLTAPPRTASTMHLLHRRGAQSVTEIAAAIRQSHPLVITWIRQLTALQLVRSATDPRDRRRTVVALTARGEAEARRMLEADVVIAAAYDALLAEAGADDVFGALWRIEEVSRGRPFGDRLREAGARRAGRGPG